MKTHLVTFAVVLLIGLSTPIESSVCAELECRLTLRIDRDCRLWWNIRRTTPEDLPYLLTSDSAVEGLSQYAFDIPALYDLVRDFLERRRHCEIRVISHPRSHYVGTDNVWAVLDMIEAEFNHLAAHQLNKPLDSLSDNERFTLQYDIEGWDKRDDLILAATFVARGIADSLGSTVPEEYTFKFQKKAGRWADRHKKISEILW